jgi:hypothetical protein
LRTIKEIEKTLIAPMEANRSKPQMLNCRGEAPLRQDAITTAICHARAQGSTVVGGLGAKRNKTLHQTKNPTVYFDRDYHSSTAAALTATTGILGPAAENLDAFEVFGRRVTDARIACAGGEVFQQGLMVFGWECAGGLNETGEGFGGEGEH